MRILWARYQSFSPFKNMAILDYIEQYTGSLGNILNIGSGFARDKISSFGLDPFLVLFVLVIILILYIYLRSRAYGMFKIVTTLIIIALVAFVAMYILF